MSCGIYKITNNVNQHCYIGQSINIESRWVHHKNFSKSMNHYPLYLAFEKYGIENFTFEIIEECPIEKLNEREIYWIQYYNSYYDGYNQTTGGQEGNTNNIIKISKEDILIIYDLLQNTNIPQKIIAEQFGVGQDTISEINQGKTRINPNLKYPLRQNKKEEKHCPKCGKIIYPTSEYCDTCRKFLNRITVRPNREELKNLIRTLPFTEIGARYNVSDNAIRKWCDAEHLPRKKTEINSYSDEEWKLI